MICFWGLGKDSLGKYHLSRYLKDNLIRHRINEVLYVQRPWGWKELALPPKSHMKIKKATVARRLEWEEDRSVEAKLATILYDIKDFCLLTQNNGKLLKVWAARWHNEIYFVDLLYSYFHKETIVWRMD